MYDLSAIKPKKVPIKLCDGKERSLLYDLNALAELEDVYGNYATALEQLQTGSLKAIRAALWAGLIHADESLTLKDVGAMLPVGALEQIAGPIVEAFENAVPTEPMPEPTNEGADGAQDF